MVHADPDALSRVERIRAIDFGRAVFADRCATCHGADGRGGGHGSNGGGQTWAGDLTRPARLYGSGRVSETEQIVRHGIRSGDGRGWNLAAMPAYATPRPYARYAVDWLRPGEIDDVTQYVLGLSGRASDAAAAARGERVYAARGQCYDCHQPDARGDSAIGAPDLTNGTWLYGGSAADIRRSIAVGRAGVSPAFRAVLTPAEQRAVAVYTASLIRPAVSGR